MGRALDRISGYGHVALRYGLEEAIFLDSLMFWYRENRANDRNFRDGRWWTYNSVSALVQMFPWWSAKQLRRITESCREQGAVLTESFNEDRRDRTLWYTPGAELLELYGLDSAEAPEAAGQFPESGNCIGPNGQTDLPERASKLAQMGKSYKDTCYYHVCTNMDTPLPPLDEMPEMPKSGNAASAGTGKARPQGSAGAAQATGTSAGRPQGSAAAAQATGTSAGRPQGSAGAAQAIGTSAGRPQGSAGAAQATEDGAATPPKKGGKQGGDAQQTDEVSAVFDACAGEDRELRERLEEFREERAKKKKPLRTRRAAVVLAGKLDRLSGGDRAVKLALLDNAILHGWDSVYPLKEDERPGTGGQDKPLRDDWVTFS